MVYRWFQNIVFAQPEFLWLLLLLPVMLVWYFMKGKDAPSTFMVSTIRNFPARSWKQYLRHILPILRVAATGALILALARPQQRNLEEQVTGEGIDIMLCLDVSGSMLAQDFIPNRLEAAKEVAANFVESRPTDRIGLVIFSGESFTQCPLTSDRKMLISQIFNIRSGFLEDGTAIGSGLATSVDRLRSSASATKIVILLTDGENNGGMIDPSTAKEIAKTLGVKVYTIGVGTEGTAPVPHRTPMGVIMQMEKVNIDEKLLTEIANETGGKYFRAKDKNALQKIYNEIDQLEKSKVEITTYRRAIEKFHPLVIIAFGLLLLEIILRATIFRKFP
ncbi:MAG TPA: VWA domain-containing protein [Parasegetibacter sp.]